jgi:hypothetical protein
MRFELSAICWHRPRAGQHSTDRLQRVLQQLDHDPRVRPLQPPERIRLSDQHVHAVSARTNAVRVLAEP